MAAAASDRLSDLPDDLLIHILSSLPSHEAARTTALSRRWRRQLWRDTATADLDYRSCRGAGNALYSLQSHDRVIRKVTITMPDWDTPDRVMSSAFEAGVEEARIEWQDGGCPHYTYAAPSPWAPWYNLNLSLDPLPRVRVLDLTGCNLRTYPTPLPRPDVVVYPCLEALWQRRCAMDLDMLQAMVDAAPKLSDLRLESLSFLRDIVEDQRMPLRLCCPAVAVLVMANLHVLNNSMGTSAIGDCRVELDAPHLRRLHYAQSMSSEDVTAFSFVSPTLHLEQVHMATHSRWTAPLHRSVLAAVVSHLRFLKITAYSIPDLANDDLPMFPNIERLEIEELCGWCNNNHAAAATAVLRLLFISCPAVRELRLKFSWLDYLQETVSVPAIQTAAIADFKPCRCDDNNDEDCCFDLKLRLPRFRRDRILNCLLRRVTVEFDMGELTCLQVWLIRFLVQNVMGLEELVIEGDKGFDSSWIEWKVASWKIEQRLY